MITSNDDMAMRVLVLAPTGRDALLSQQFLERAGVSCEVCSDLSDLREKLRAGAGCVVLAEEALEGETRGRLLASLRGQPAWSDLPVLVLTHQQAAMLPAVEELAAAGNVMLLEWPVQVATLLSAVGTALRARTRQYQIREHLAERQRAAREMEELNRTLEQRVAQRTAQFQQQTDQLRALALQLTSVEQQERRRLAQVLHDHLQQLLVAAKMRAGSLAGRAEDSEVQKHVRQIEELVGEAITASRELTTELSPPILYDAGLGPAIEWLCRWMQEKHGLEVNQSIEGEIDGQLAQELRVLLFQAVRELLFNVVKHAGVKQAELTLSQSSDGEAVVAVISDRGRGFDQRDSAGRSGGGFGLFSIRERIELLGGQFELSGAPGQGTRVMLRMPVRLDIEPVVPAAESRQPTGQEALAQPPATVSGATRERGPIRVLLADDHRIFREGVAGLLRDQSDLAVVGEAEDGLMAVELARELQPDVVVMDITMPRMDGMEATRRITAEQPQMCVIGLSMHDDKEMARAMRAAGAEAYLTKGGPAETLIATIRRCRAVEARRD